MVLNRRATEFDTQAKNWQGPLGTSIVAGMCISKFKYVLNSIRLIK